MSNHAHLVQNTLGSTVIGTVGFRILSLGKIAAQPLLPDLAKSLDLLTLWTSLRYAAHSGLVIQEQETKYGVADKYKYSLPDQPCDYNLMGESSTDSFTLSGIALIPALKDYSSTASTHTSILW